MDMKLGRRGFLGIMGGAAAAGPSLANDVLHGSSVTQSQISGQIGSVKVKRISELQAIISGNNLPSARERKITKLLSAERQEEYRINSLRSVSMTSRHRMFIEGGMDRRERMRRVEAEFELADWIAGKFG